MEFIACDVLDPNATCAALSGARSVICALGFPYSGKVWEASWPLAIRNLIGACESSQARLVIADNLYMYGPQNGPIDETASLTSFGRKPKARAEVTRIWQEAHQNQRARIVAVRAPDFYGPLVSQSLMGAQTLGAMAANRPAVLLESPDHLHDIAHIDDFARAVETLLNAPEDAYGQAWHVPCAPTQTLRALLGLAAQSLGSPLRVRVVPRAAARIASLFVPIIREAEEMRFLLDRPYKVDWSKFGKRFWRDPVPFEHGIPEAALSFRKTVQ
jgi:nucleoside-diphosphate-sugar epimerase